MTNPVLTNRIATDSVILWQYDKAINLIRLIQAWNKYATVSCTEFWNYFGNNIFPIDRADTFGLNVWGSMLGISRPIVQKGELSAERDWNNWSVVNERVAGRTTINFKPSFFGMAKDDDRILSVTVQSTDNPDRLVSAPRILQLRDSSETVLATSTNVVSMDKINTKYTFEFAGDAPLDASANYSLVFCDTSGNNAQIGIRIGLMSADVDDLYFGGNKRWEPGIEVSWKSSYNVPISDGLYRRLLKAKFFMMTHTPTVPNYNKFLSILFGATKDGVKEFDTRKFYNCYGEPNVDNDGNELSSTYSTRCIALDFQNMTMGFSFPTEATDEEAYLILQHYDMVYPFPAGIRYAGEFVYDDIVIGLNKDQTIGQDYKAFVDGLVLADDDSGNYPNGGIFSTTDRANYKVSPTVVGNAYIYNAAVTGEEISLSFISKNTSKRVAVWIDWGNGFCGYHYLPKGSSEAKTFTTEYTTKGLYPILVLFDAAEVAMDAMSFTPVRTYELSVNEDA